MTPPGQDPRGPSDDEVDVFVERALAAVAPPAARSEFKEKLRREFCSAPRRDPTTPLFDVVDEPRPRSKGIPARFVWAGLAAAAALVALIVYFKPADSRWKVLEGTTAGVVTIDGIPIPSDDRARLEKSLVEAHDIHTNVAMRARFGDWYVLELAPDSHVMLSPIEQRARTEPLYFQLAAGSLRVRTGPSFHGDEMRVDTDDLSVRITGTTVAVELVDDGTCVCCLTGTVKIVPSKSKTNETLCGSGTYHVFRSDKAPATGEIIDRHAEPLHAIDVLARQLWP